MLGGADLHLGLAIGLSLCAVGPSEEHPEIGIIFYYTGQNNTKRC